MWEPLAFDKSVKLRDPKDIIPLHEVIFPDKVVNMVRFLNKGGELPPVVSWGDDALSGTHRLAAHVIAGKMVPVIQLPDDFVYHYIANNGITEEEDLFIDANDTLEFLGLYDLSHPKKGKD